MADLYKSLNLPKQRVHVQDAGFLKRMLAFLADILLLDFFVFSSFSVLLPQGLELGRALNGDFPTSVYAAAIVMSLLALTYFSLFEYLLEQSPGMMLLNIRVENVTLWRAFIRNIYLLPVFPFPILWVLEPLHLLWRKTRMLELLTKTRTIERITY